MKYRGGKERGRKEGGENGEMKERGRKK